MKKYELSQTWSAEEIAGDNVLINMVKEGAIRKCSCCGRYTDVEEYANESIIHGKMYESICDACSDKIEDGASISDIEVIEEYEYEDYLEDYEYEV